MSVVGCSVLGCVVAASRSCNASAPQQYDVLAVGCRPEDKRKGTFVAVWTGSKPPAKSKPLFCVWVCGLYDSTTTTSFPRPARAKSSNGDACRRSTVWKPYYQPTLPWAASLWRDKDNTAWLCQSLEPPRGRCTRATTPARRHAEPRSLPQSPCSPALHLDEPTRTE